MNELKPCPFCGGKVTILVCDNEGNIRRDDYENDPWSGLGYQIAHVHESNIGCPIARYDDKATMGVYIYGSREEAIAAWNKRFESIDEDRPKLTAGQKLFLLTGDTLEDMEKISVYCTTSDGFIIDGDGSELTYSSYRDKWFTSGVEAWNTMIERRKKKEKESAK